MMGEAEPARPEEPAGPEEPSAGAEGAAATVEALEQARVGPPATDSIADGVGVRSTYAVNLEVFEGPLDLLLHLVRRHELDILDIPISFIAEKYIEYISFARSLDIEVAGEYLLMAATLAYLKSRELLPPVPSEDEEEGEEDEGVDPREELIRRLIEYERFRDAGFALAERPIAGRDVFARGGELGITPPEPGLAPVTLFRLAEAYNRVLDRARINADHEVVIERVTVRQRMLQLSKMLGSKPKIGFEELFLSQTWSSEVELRQMLVVTLMSVLEMVKLGVLGVHQAQGSDTLDLERVVEVKELDQVVALFRGDDEEDEALGDEGADESPEAGDGATAEGDAESAALVAMPVAGESQSEPEAAATEPEPGVAPVVAPVETDVASVETNVASVETEVTTPEVEPEVATPEVATPEVEPEVAAESEAAPEPEVPEPDVVERGSDVAEPEADTSDPQPEPTVSENE